LDGAANRAYATGAHNAPATKAGEGLECDKFNPCGVEAQQEAFVDKMLAAATPEGRRAYKHTWIDSWEVARRTGLRNSLPSSKRGGVTTLPLVSSACGRADRRVARQVRAVSLDFRRTIAESYRGELLERAMALAKQHGIEFRAEPVGRQQFMYDPVNYARACDMPCGEFWVGGGRGWIARWPPARRI